MKAKTYSVDLASQVFQVHGYDEQGQRIFQRRMKRARFSKWCDEVDQLVVMEATSSAQHWGRVLQARGVAVKLLPPQHVKAMLVGNKTDANDADAIYEASLRPKVRPVPVKTAEEQALLAEHRMREGRIRDRTRLVNQMRGLLREFGVVLDKHIDRFRRQLPAVLEDAENGLPDRMRTLLAEAWQDLTQIDQRVQVIDARLAKAAKENADCQRLLAVEGFGPVTVTALVAHQAQASACTRSRQFSASLGLVPREHSSGNRRQLGSITKRGNTYLRMQLIHGARSAVRAARRKDDSRSRWIQALEQRVGTPKAIVAVANKNARIAWALLTSKQSYRHPAA